MSNSSPRVDQKMSCRFWIQNQDHWVPKTSLLHVLFHRFKAPGSPEGEVLKVMQLEGKRALLLSALGQEGVGMAGNGGCSPGAEKAMGLLREWGKAPSLHCGNGQAMLSS